MPGKNGLSAKIVAYVQDNPGRTGRQLGEALGFKHGGGLLSFMRKSGLIFGAGPRHWTAYYSTQAEAEAATPEVAQRAKETRAAKIKALARRDTERRTAARRAGLAQRALAVQMLGLAAKTVIVPPTVKITIAATPPPRFAPGPGFVGAISSDYVARRQGVAVGAA